MEQEIWKDIIGYEGLYQVSSLSRVKRVQREVYHPLNGTYIRKELMKQPYINKKGYCIVGLSNNGVKVNMKLHRIVASAFIPNPNNYPQINHKNGNKSDNRVVNLEWCTGKHNIQHAVKNGLKPVTDRQRKSASDMMKKKVGGLNYAAKLVVNIESGIFYDTTKEAAESISKTRRTFSKYLSGLRKNTTSLRYA